MMFIARQSCPPGCLFVSLIATSSCIYIDTHTHIFYSLTLVTQQNVQNNKKKQKTSTRTCNIRTSDATWLLRGNIATRHSLVMLYGKFATTLTFEVLLASLLLFLSSMSCRSCGMLRRITSPQTNVKFESCKNMYVYHGSY